MSEHVPTVYIVDDDPGVVRALVRLVKAHGYQAVGVGDAWAFLDARAADPGPACVMLDLQMPGMDGIALQRRLDGELPVIFVTGHADVPSTILAMLAGATDFLLKPVQEDALLASLERACRCAVARHLEHEEMAGLRERLERLTPREREVMAWVVTGRLNKQVASELGTVEKTIKAHRASVMRKLEVGSLAELVRMADKLGLPAVAAARTPHRAGAGAGA